MIRTGPLTFALLIGLTAVLLPVPTANAQGDGPRLTAEVGIGGRYRPGGWIPITVGVVNSGAEDIHGQIKITQSDADGIASGASFARPVEFGPGPSAQSVQIYERGFDPGSQDVAVTLVDGKSRGDGAVRAKITSQAADAHTTFTGIPVSPTDLLIVGLSADTTAITRLNGQQWGLMHAVGGVVPQSQVPMNGTASNPSTAQAAVAAPADLPDRPAGYDGVDAVLLGADAPLDALTEAQADALKAWIAAGGHLVVGGGTRIAPYGDPFYTGLLPASVASASASGLMLGPKPLPGVRILASSQGLPLAVTGPYGAGQVTLLASDLRTVGPNLWKTILMAGSSSLLGVAVAQETNIRYYYYGGGGQLSDAVMRAPSLDAPGADAVGLFLLSYLLILVPLNYLILKRLDRKEWSWVTIPGLVAVFAAVTYGAGDAAKGNSVFINRAEILETTSGRDEAGVYAAVGLFSPRRTSYDLSLSDPDALLSDPQLPRQRFYPGQAQTDTAPSGPASFLEGVENVTVQDADVNMWSMRAFDLQSATDLGGAVTANLRQNTRTGALSGSLTNGTPHALAGCRVYLNGSWQPVPDLPSGGSATISGILPLPAGRSISQAWNANSSPTGPTLTGSVQQRMQLALASFVGSLGAGGNSRYSYGYGGEPPVFFQPRPGEAILTGYCVDSTLGGPNVRVDGHPVTLNTVACIVVHVPLR